MIKIYGDSHAAFSFRNLDLPNENYFESGITMHRIGRDQNIVNYNETINNDENIICFVYGEIDCRCHIQKQINLGFNKDDIIFNLVDNYFKTIDKKIHSKHIIIVGVIPPTKQHECEFIHGPIQHEYPFVGTDEDRVNYTFEVNKLIQHYCNIYKYQYFNPYSYYENTDGTMNFKFSDNNVHLQENSFFLTQFKELYNKLIL